jgi:hypothetical protein
MKAEPDLDFAGRGLIRQASGGFSPRDLSADKQIGEA